MKNNYEQGLTLPLLADFPLSPFLVLALVLFY